MTGRSFDPVPLAGTAELCLPKQWTSDGEITVSGDDGFRIAYAGGFFTDRIAEGPKVAVAPGDFIRGDLTFSKRRWEYSSFAAAHLAFYSARDKLIRRIRFDRSNISGYSPYSLHEFLTMAAANGEKVTYFNFFKVPDNAAYFRPGWTFRYNPATVEISALSFQKVDGSGKPWRGQPKARGTKVFALNEVNDAEVERRLRDSRHPVSTVRREGDRVNLYVDGKRMPPFFMHNTPYNVRETERWTAEFNRIGFRFATVWVTLGRGIKPHLPAALAPDGTLDVAPWRAAVRAHLRQNPGGYIILALDLFPSQKFLDENDDQLMKDKDGVNFIFGYPYYPLGKGAAKELPKGNFSRYPSMASEKYTRHITGELVRALTEFEKYPESKAVAGVYLLGGDDAQFRLPNIHTTPDRSPLVLAAFKAFLREKYRTDEALRKAWSDPEITFDTVTIPVIPELWPKEVRYYTDSPETVKYADYKNFYSGLDRKFKIAVRGAVKQAFPRLLVGSYDCAYGIGGSWGHTGLHFGESIDDKADFYLFIPSYGRDRDWADCSLGAYQFSGSLVMHNKLGIMELDVRNPEIGPLYFGHYRSANYCADHGAESFRVSLLRLAVQSAVLGGGFHYYNLQPHWCRTDRAGEALREMYRIAACARSVPPGRDRIALLTDEDSNLSSNTHPGWIPSFFAIKNIPVMAVQRAGVKFNYFLAKDALRKDFDAPGVLFFADAATLSPEEIAAIRERFGNSGRVIVWQGAPGFLKCRDWGRIGKAVGFDIAPMPDYPDGPLECDRDYEAGYREKHLPVPLFSAGSGDPLMRGIHGFFMQSSTVVPYVFPPCWQVRGAGAVTLANYYGTDIPGMAVRRHKDFTEVFIGQPGAVTPQLFRNLAREAGIIPSLETDDLFYCGSGLIGVGASTGSGRRMIRFPAGYRKVESLTGHKVEKVTAEGFECVIPYRDFAVFRIE